MEYMMEDVYKGLCEGRLEAPWWADAYAYNEAVFAHDVRLAMNKFMVALQKGEHTWECFSMGCEKVPGNVRTFWERGVRKGRESRVT